MTGRVEDIFIAGSGIDMVFNMDSLSPIIKPSFIFECNYKTKQMVVSQTSPKINRNYKYDQMTITTLVKNEQSDKKRIGLNCGILKFLDLYQLSNKSQESAISIQYSLPLLESNIRAAFRLQPNPRFDVVGKLIYNDNEYFSGKELKIHDISISGIGLLIPKTIIKKQSNPLLRIKVGSNAKLGLLLRDLNTDEKGIIISGIIGIIRVNTNYSEKYAFAGIRFTKMKSNDEEKLSKYIHEAQLYQIRELQKL